MAGRKKIAPIGEKKIVITEDIAREAKNAFFSILNGIGGSQEEPMTPEQIEKVVVTCIGVMIFCRGFFVEPKPGANKKFYNFIEEVMSQMEVKPEEAQPQDPAA